MAGAAICACRRFPFRPPRRSCNNEIGIFTNDPSVSGRMRALTMASRSCCGGDTTGEVDTEEEVRRDERAQRWLRQGLEQRAVARRLQRSPDRSGPSGRLAGERRQGHAGLSRRDSGKSRQHRPDKNDPRFSIRQLLSLLDGVKHRRSRSGPKLSPEETTALLKELVPNLIKLSSAPTSSSIGANFGTNLPDADKQALIEFVKTLATRRV